MIVMLVCLHPRIPPVGQILLVEMLTETGNTIEYRAVQSAPNSVRFAICVSAGPGDIRIRLSSAFFGNDR